MSEKIFRHIENRYYTFLDNRRAIELALISTEGMGNNPELENIKAELLELKGKIDFAEELLSLEKHG